MKKWLFCVLFFVFSFNSIARVYTPLDSDNVIIISGTIENGESEIFKKTVEEKKHLGVITVSLSSDGGSLLEAMKIGKIIRDNKMWAVVPYNSRCLSSCVFLLAAGVFKNPVGLVGIHRPYITDTNNKNVDFSMKNIMKNAENYLDEMNVPKSLVEEMFSISPENIKYLTNNEKIKFRLDGEDWGFKEQREIDTAKKLNISRIEYMRREGLYYELEGMCAKKFPNIDVDYIKCANQARKSVGLLPLSKED